MFAGFMFVFKKLRDVQTHADYLCCILHTTASKSRLRKETSRKRFKNLFDNVTRKTKNERPSPDENDGQENR